MLMMTSFGLDSRYLVSLMNEKRKEVTRIKRIALVSSSAISSNDHHRLLEVDMIVFPG